MKVVARFASIILATAAASASAQEALPDRHATVRPAIEDAGAPPPSASAEVHTVAPKPLKRGNPEYPRAAFRKGIEGSVLLEFSVGADGRVVAPRVVEATPPGVFDRAALEAVSEWTYQRLGTETKDMKVRLTFRKRGRAPWTPAPPSSTIVRGQEQPVNIAADPVAEHLPPPAADPASR